MKQLFTPFQDTSKKTNLLIIGFWLLMVVVMWLFVGNMEGSFFPSLGEVGSGFVHLWNEGAVTHFGRSLYLCLKAIGISVLISMILVYTSPIPILKPLASSVSAFRFLPLAGITFYLTMATETARDTQEWVLIIFMTTYLVTSLLSVISDIPEREFDHARSLGCNRWQVLWEVVIRGRLDYAIDVIRQNFAIVWMMLVTVETFSAANGGIGFLIRSSEKLGDHGKMVALQILILVVGILLNLGINTLRKVSFRYSKF